MSVFSILRRPRTLVTVEPVLFLFMFSVFLSYPTYQQLLHHTICANTANCTDNPSSHNNSSSNSSSCVVSSDVESQVQQETSHWILYTNLAFTLPAILVSLLYGAFSDVYGRNLFVVLPVAGTVVNSAIVLMVNWLAPSHLYLYLIGALFCGLGGGYSVLNLAAYSYMADISCHHSRTPRIAILESMTYFGATLSSGVSGVWISSQGYVSPYWAILPLQLVVILYVLLALPPSRSDGGKKFLQRSVNLTRKEDSESRFVLASVQDTLSTFFRMLFQNSSLSLLLLVFLMVEMNFMGINDIVVLYTLSRPLCWAPELIGYFLAGKVFMNGMAALLVLPFLSYCKVPDTVIVLIGLLSGATALVTMGTASHTWVMIIVPVVGGMRGCVVPCVRAMMSKRTPVHQQGVLFAGISVVEAVSSLLASVIYNAVFPITYRVYPGLCFFVMAAMLLLPFLLILVLMRSSSSSKCPPRVGETDEDSPLLQ